MNNDKKNILSKIHELVDNFPTSGFHVRLSRKTVGLANHDHTHCLRIGKITKTKAL